MANSYKYRQGDQVSKIGHLRFFLLCTVVGIIGLFLLILWPLWRNDDDVKLACSPEPLPEDPPQPEGFFSTEVLEQIYGPLPWKDDE